MEKERREEKKKKIREEGRKKETRRTKVWISMVWYGSYGFVLILVCSISRV